jgi:transcriptional regulator with XRE-family HTH domain
MTGQELKMRRQALRLTLAELAIEMHTTAACLSRWENGKRAIPKVAAAYFVNWVEPEIKKRITHV